MNTLETRPAETAGIAASAAFLIAKALGLDDADSVAAIAVVIGFVPAAVTFIVVQIRKAKANGV